MKVYHGSYMKIDDIDLSKVLPNKDFGRGFYVTKIRRHAENWARIIGLKHQTEGFVTEFEYSETAFTRSVCKIKCFDGYSEEWLDFVVMNRDRNVPEPAHEYDIVEGPVADDKIQNRINDYLKGKITKSVFLQDLIYHEQTHQICFCTGRSLQMIDRTDRENDFEYEIIKAGEAILEQLIIHFGMDEENAANAFYSSHTFSLLADKTTVLYLKPWQEIYEMLKSELKM